MSASAPIRSVVRAIELLQALNRQSVSTLDALHAQTGIPKPTIVRMLQTFESLQIARHAPQHGAYYLSSGIRSLSSGYHSEPMVIDAAAPLMDELTLRFKWPMAIAVLENGAMVVRYSTIPLSPLALKHSTIGVRLSLVSRAIGRAYLAFCPPDQQEALLKQAQASDAPEDQAARDAEGVRRMLRQVREAGYALRDPHIWPATNTLAVPVFDGAGPAASLGMTFFSSTMEPQQAAERFLPGLQEIAARVGDRLRELQAG